MDTLKSENLLQTVRLIPIFNYLNILSDFLIIEHYLSEVNQTKQIPIVNALYEYLDDHHNIQFMKVNLIRSLLQDSDLYGAKRNENLDVVFVNAMFDYIISSLVFDKYGNIYGFLADVFRKAENLQMDYILNMIIENLKCASFENENGERSTLSSLAVNRIYNDILLPLFPQAEKNLSLSSLDYIYAQAGSMFLKAGRKNTAYYNDVRNSSASNPYASDQFNEYLTTGHVIAKLLLTENPNSSIQTAFALPALTNYIFSSKYLFAYENVGNIVTDPNFWQKAYTNLFQNKIFPFNDAVHQLTYDHKLQMHLMLSSFKSRNEIAKVFIKFYCHNSKTPLDMLLFAYLKYPENFKCETASLPNLNKWYMNQINDFAEIYKAFDLELVQWAFGSSLINYLRDAKVTIKLLPPNDKVLYADFSNSEYLSYDILEIFFPERKTLGYYALIRENYNVTLISNATDSKLFLEKVGLSADTLRKNRGSIILKTSDDNMNEFWENLMQYKLTRLQSYLQFLDDHQENEELWKSEWWKEFGLSLVPHYPCLLNTQDIYYKKDVCKFNKIDFFDKFQDDVLAKIVHAKSQSLLSLLGATIKSVFLENVGRETVNDFLEVQNTDKNSVLSLLNGDKFREICLHLEEPAFQIAPRKDLVLLKKVIIALKERTLLNLSSVESHLNMMIKLKSDNFRSVGTVGERDRLMYVKTLNASDTGYGYKFFFLSDNITEIAFLRTDYESQAEKFVFRMDSSKYIVLNNVTLKSEPNQVMYEVNNKLRNKLIKVLFYGITIDQDNEKCETGKNINQKSDNVDICLRQRRFFEKLGYQQEAIKFAKTKINLSEKLILNTFKKYTFFDNETIFRFVEDWTKNENLMEPRWSKIYMINNPDLLDHLRFSVRLENHDVSDYDGKFRINSIYSQGERRKIEEEQLLGNIIKEYSDKKNYYSVTLEDYYAIRNFATTGFERITQDTLEGKLMKFALYKLAVRQFEDPLKEYELKLFTVECKPIDIANRINSKKDLILQKFTLASTSLKAAARFAVSPKLKFINVVYEMEFRGPYARVKIDQFYESKEKKIILVPGCEFVIEDSGMEFVEGLGNVLKIKLRFKDNAEKHEVYKNIMNKIADIQF